LDEEASRLGGFESPDLLGSLFKIEQEPVPAGAFALFLRAGARHGAPRACMISGSRSAIAAMTAPTSTIHVTTLAVAMWRRKE